jgi:hypothetical protein
MTHDRELIYIYLGSNGQIMSKALALILILAILQPGASTFWRASISTNSSSWSIYRLSDNLSFDSEGSIKGSVSPVTAKGRILGCYHSRYAHISSNDVHLDERTNAREGRVVSDEITRFRAYSNDNAVINNITKPSGSPVYTFKYWEVWPVLLISRKELDYSGAEINDRDMVYNNLDYVGTSHFYGKELHRSRVCGLDLERMNATVGATDDSLLSYDFMPTKSTLYRDESKASSLTRIKYKQADTDQLSANTINAIQEGDDVFYGDFNINTSLLMRSTYENATHNDPWLELCYCNPDGLLDYNRSVINRAAFS